MTSPDLVYVALGGSLHELHVWDDAGFVDTGYGTGPNTVPFQCRVSPNGHWVALAAPNGYVQFFDTITKTMGAEINSTLTSAYGVAWAPDNSKAYFAGIGGAVSVTLAGTVTSLSTSADFGNQQIAVSPDGSKLYVCCGNWSAGTAAAAKVVVIDTTSGAALGVWGSGTLPSTYGIAINTTGSTIYVSDYEAASVGTPGSVWPIATATGTVGTPISAPNLPSGLVLSPDNSKLWVACQGGSGSVTGSVNVYDAVTGASLAIITVANAYQLAMSNDGTTVWVAAASGGQIVPIDTSSHSVGVGNTYTAGLQGIAMWPASPGGGGGGLVSSAVVLGPLTIAAHSTITAPTITGTAVLNIGPLVVRAADSLATRLGTISVLIGPLIVAQVGARPGPGGFPIPGYRGRWRLTLHTRTFAPATLSSTLIAELADARGRQLVQAWGTPAVLTFSMDGHAQAAALIEELEHDVVAWRFDDRTGLEVAVFRGPITASQDQLTTESHTVTYTCQDYAAVLSRRLLTTTYTVTARDQDLIAGDLLAAGSAASSSSGTSFSPASYVPVTLATVNPDGTTRGLSTRTRDRTYYGSQNVYDALDALAKIIDGFDWDVQPSATNTTDSLRVFYPAQGVTRTDIALQYGSTVATVTRSLSSADYSNYVRVLGNNTSANPTPQFFAEDWNTQAHATSPIPVGLWMTDDTSQTSVTVQSTLDEKASGDLALDANLTPTYTLGLTPDWYTWGHPNMGDTVPLIVQSGRLDDYYTPGVRVLGITYQIGDDGQEDVTLTVSRPTQTVGGILAAGDRDLKALTRR
jgi:sugar lactone lactonase YvrE